MAQFQAVRVTCEAITELLKAVYTAQPTGLPVSMGFHVFVAEDFKTVDSSTNGISLFLYRAYVNANQRATQRRDPATGKTTRPPLPLELHFFLTTWAKTASLQHNMLGWMMRTLEDFPCLTASFLNERGSGTFSANETVEIIPGQLTNEELMRIWEDLQVPYQLSVPYVARIVRIDSTVELGEDGLSVIQRDFDMQVPKG